MMKKSILKIWLLVFLIGVMGCSKAPEVVEKPVEEKGDSYYPVTITNYNYAKEPIEITIEKEPTKVFAVYQNSIETLLALGLEDKIVAAAGLDQDVKPEYQAAFEKINYLTEFSPDKESVMMLEPDFILSWYSYFGEKKLGEVDFWHEKGVKTYMMKNSGAAEERSLNNEYEDILTLGKIFNVNDKAEKIVEEMKTKVEAIAKEAQKNTEKPNVLVMEFGKDNVRTYGKDTLGGDMVNSLGASALSPEGNKMSNEDLIQANPDVIFTVYFGSSSSVADADAAIELLTKDPKFASLKAVQENRVYAISLGEMYCSGTRTLDGIVKLAKGIYPEMKLE